MAKRRRKGTGKVRVKGYMRNGKRVKGYSRKR